MVRGEGPRRRLGRGAGASGAARAGVSHGRERGDQCAVRAVRTRAPGAAHQIVRGRRRCRGQRELARGGAVLRLAFPKRRTLVSAADGSGMGVCLPRRLDDALRLRRRIARSLSGARAESDPRLPDFFPRGIGGAVVLSRAGKRAAVPRRAAGGQHVGTLRPSRQRRGVVPRLVCALRGGRAARSERARERGFSRHPRRGGFAVCATTPLGESFEHDSDDR